MAQRPIRRWSEDVYDVRPEQLVRDAGTPRRNLSKLARNNPAAWNDEWRRLKREQPALAEMLKGDDFFNALRTAFDADVLIEVGHE